MSYSLRRTRDGAGDSGGMSMIITLNENGNAISFDYGRPKIGCVVRVGSIAARSFSAQDYWQTTPVTEILEETENYIHFKTTNSEYEWTEF
jgi:hypothetical protein